MRLRDAIGSEIDRKSAAGMRDRMAHSYADANISGIRLTVLNDIPALKEKCLHVLSVL